MADSDNNTWFQWPLESFKARVDTAQEGDCISSTAFELRGRDVKGVIMYLSFVPIFKEDTRYSGIHVSIASIGSFETLRLGYEFWASKGKIIIGKTKGKFICIFTK